MSDTAVGRRINDLTLRQALAITDAALDLAIEAGLPISRFSVDPHQITIHPQPGRGIELAYHFGLDEYFTTPLGDGFAGASGGYWGGIRVVIADRVAEAFVPETRAAA